MSVVIPSLRGAIAVPGWAKNELWRKARAVPSLDLRFADSKSLVDATTGSNLVTFTRASSGTFVGSAGVIQTAATDAPRFDHNPTTGESLGLLVEEQRTNLLLRSEEFDNASWDSTAGARTVTANQIAAPNGATTADLFTADGTNAAHFVSQSVTLTATAFTFSVFAKKGTNDFLQLRCFNAFGGMFANFDLATGVAGSVGTISGTTPTSFVQAYPGGWYRCTMVFTPTAATSSLAAYIVNSSSAVGGQVNSLNTTLYLWGAQLEAGAFPTSYTPTLAATVTRSADVASISGSNFDGWYRQDEGTFLSHYAAGVNGARPFFASNSDTQERFEQRVLTNFRQGTVMLAGVGNSEYAETTRAFVAGTAWKHAIAQNGTTLAVGSELNVAEIAISRSPSVDRLWVGSFIGTGTFLNGTFRRLTFWPTRLPNSTLQSITQ
jgi:hypothetical protein